jgi:hypothetical protein
MRMRVSVLNSVSPGFFLYSAFSSARLSSLIPFYCEEEEKKPSGTFNTCLKFSLLHHLSHFTFSTLPIKASSSTAKFSATV